MRDENESEKFTFAKSKIEKYDIRINCNLVTSEKLS